ncbi:MTH1187 family thiamine-binding protein [Salibacterium sp. K-3]
MKGLSYQNGVIFIGREHAGWAEWNRIRPEAAVMPLTFSSMLKISSHVFLSMPSWYKVSSALVLCMIIIPFMVRMFTGMPVHGLPFYSFLYYLMGTHFFFPQELRKFHGAEHKVFSFKGIKRRRNLYRIKKAPITNRYCSTNTVVLYFVLTAAGCLLMLAWLSWSTALAVSSYAGLPLSLFLHRMLQLPSMKMLRSPLLFISYAVQRHVSCAVPDRRHLRTALEAYRALAEKEFPYALEEKKPVSTKEVQHMAILDITVVPVGTSSTSMSEDVAGIQQLLDHRSDKIKYQLTPMGTVIEGELDDLLPIVKEVHELPFQRGAERVSTNIRIDDRRDKENQDMNDKVKSVENKQNE